MQPAQFLDSGLLSFLVYKFSQQYFVKITQFICCSTAINWFYVRVWYGVHIRSSDSGSRNERRVFCKNWMMASHGYSL
jgi:hypothetical protein